MKQVKIEVFGRVQGVNFRNNVKNFCDETGLFGTVQNNNDGSVLIVMQGSQKKLAELVRFLKSNPGFSRVEKIEQKIEVVKEKMHDFIVLHEGNFVNDKGKALENLTRKLLKR